MHDIKHDPIPEDVKPDVSYVAGFLDAKACFICHGANRIFVSAPQKHVAVLKHIKWLYNGRIGFKKIWDGRQIR